MILSRSPTFSSTSFVVLCHGKACRKRRISSKVNKGPHVIYARDFQWSFATFSTTAVHLISMPDPTMTACEEPAILVPSFQCIVSSFYCLAHSVYLSFSTSSLTVKLYLSHGSCLSRWEIQVAREGWVWVFRCVQDNCDTPSCR